jgi:peroxiredoxin
LLIFLAGKNALPGLTSSVVTNNSASSTLTTNQKLLGGKAPYFDLSDISGNRIRLSDYLNSPVVLVFWATWNQSSSDQIKILDDYLSSKNVQNDLIKVIAVDSLEDSSLVKSFIKRGDYSVPVAFDSVGDISNNYNVKSLPTTYFIDKNGIVREIYTGILSENMIVDKVENILK